MKTCPACRQSRPRSAFYKNRCNKDGYATYCKPCQRTKSLNGRTSSRHWTLKARYGITEADYEALFVWQGGRCCVCLLDGKRLVVDHDHKTGEVRGLLCDGCNVAMFIIENPERLRRALAYIQGCE